MIVLRMKRNGSKKRPCYRVVAIESSKRRDGRSVEDLGYYHPLANPPAFNVNMEKLKGYVANGAMMSDTVAAFVKKHDTKS